MLIKNSLTYEKVFTIRRKMENLKKFIKTKLGTSNFIYSPFMSATIKRGIQEKYLQILRAC